MKSFAIGDIHGQYNTLVKLIEKLPIDWQQDELIFLGDLIDRGPAVRKVLEYVQKLTTRSPRVRVLRGNHEQVLLNSLEYQHSFAYWMCMGGDATYESYCPPIPNPCQATFIEKFPTEQRLFLEQTLIRYKNEHAIFVHAGARRMPDGEWKINSNETALWYRDVDLWAGYRGETMVVGHTPTNKIRNMLREPQQPDHKMTAWQNGDLIAIDCGAGHEGRLCSVELPSRRFYYQSVTD